jgi:glycerol-3-phosphate acyltransferase PlsY
MSSALPIAVVVAAYLIGSIPFSFLVVKLFAGADIRQHGSRNVGATNVARTFGKLPGIIALLLDIGKGFAAVEAARWITAQHSWPVAPAPTAANAALYSRELWISGAAVAAVLAHMFPVWLRFHGGKGVATACGAFLALDPIVVLAAMLVFLLVTLIFRMVSLASIVSAAAIPLFFHFLAAGSSIWRTYAAIVIAIAVIAKHHSNIARMAGGTERRLGQPRGSAQKQDEND